MSHPGKSLRYSNKYDCGHGRGIFVPEELKKTLQHQLEEKLMNTINRGILFFCLFGTMANANSAINYQSDGRYIFHSKATPTTKTPTTPFADFNINWFAYEAGASQISSVTSNSMSGSGSTYAGYDAMLYGATGASEFSVTFGVDQLTDFSLSGNLDSNPAFGGFDGNLFVTLKENGANIFYNDQYSGSGVIPFSFGGQFLTGNTYQLILHSDSWNSTYYNETWNFNLTTAPAIVPIPAAAWLLGSGLLGLAGIARKRKAS